MRARWLGWSFGLGARVRGMLKLCAALMLLAFILKGPIERHESLRRRDHAGASSAAARAHHAVTARPPKVASATGHAPAPAPEVAGLNVSLQGATASPVLLSGRPAVPEALRR